MASAADVTFKDVVREACLSRDHFMAWTDAPAASRPRRRRCRPRSASTPSDTIEDVEREIVDGPHLPRSRWEEIAAILDTGSKTERDQAARLREALIFTGSAQVEEYLGVFLTDDRSAAQIGGDEEIWRQQSRRSRACSTPEGGRIGRLIERRRARDDPRPHRRRCCTIATAAAANYRREKQERGLLDYDDLIDKTLAMLDRVPPAGCITSSTAASITC